MTFAEWFEQHWQKQGETRSRAVARMHVEIGLSQPAIFRALDRQPLRQSTISKLVKLCGGHVSAETFLVEADATA